MTKSTNIHQPVIRLETNVVYSCLSEASKAMGKYAGYVSERMRMGKPCVDAEGSLWTFQLVDPSAIALRRSSRRCYIEEMPGRIFDNPTQAAKAIGRSSDYITGCARRGNQIKDKAGNIVHLYYLDEK